MKKYYIIEKEMYDAYLVAKVRLEEESLQISE